jgi:hypothetical protein
LMPKISPDISRLSDARSKTPEFEVLRCTNFPQGAASISTRMGPFGSPVPS